MKFIEYEHIRIYLVIKNSFIQIVMTPKEKNIRGLCSLITNWNTFIKCPDLSKGKKNVSQTMNFHPNIIKYTIILCGINFNHSFGQISIKLKQTLISRNNRTPRREVD